MRLCALLQEKFNHFDTNALMAMMCFHGARIEAKLDEHNDLVQLEYQDRSKWNYPLIFKGHEYMDYAVKAETFSRYHWEAAIAGAHIMAPTFEEVDWEKIEMYYDRLIALVPSSINQLNRIVVLSQQGKMEEAFDSYNALEGKDFGERMYLYYAVGAELYFNIKEIENGSKYLNWALEKVQNEIERKLVLKRIDEIKKGNQF
jgi:RNA polymerase sigma-70 factor (ECF subfamily)